MTDVVTQDVAPSGNDTATLDAAFDYGRIVVSGGNDSVDTDSADAVAADDQATVAADAIAAGDDQVVTDSPDADAQAKADAEAAKYTKKDDTPGWMKREVGIERDRRRQAEARAAQLEQRLAELERGAPAQRPAPEPQPATQQAASGAPNMDDPRYHQTGQFDAMTYIQDVADWRAEQKIQAFWQQQQAEAQQQREAYAAQQAQREADARRDAALQREDALRDAHADYEQTVSPVIDVLSRARNIGHPLPELILAEDNAPDLIYYLGQNPKEFADLLDMNPRQALKAMGRIEDKISTPKAADTQTQTQRQSPPKPPPKGIEPLKQIKGGAAVISLEERMNNALDGDDAGEFIKLFNEAQKQRKKA